MSPLCEPRAGDASPNWLPPLPVSHQVCRGYLACYLVAQSVTLACLPQVLTHSQRSEWYLWPVVSNFFIGFLVLLAVLVIQVAGGRRPWVYYVTCGYLVQTLAQLLIGGMEHAPKVPENAKFAEISWILFFLYLTLSIVHCCLLISYSLGKASRGYFGLAPWAGSIWRFWGGGADTRRHFSIRAAPPMSHAASVILLAMTILWSFGKSYSQWRQWPHLDIALIVSVVSWVMSSVAAMVGLGALVSRLHHPWVYYFISVYWIRKELENVPSFMASVFHLTAAYPAEGFWSKVTAIYNLVNFLAVGFIAWRYIWGAPSRRSYGLENPWSEALAGS